MNYSVEDIQRQFQRWKSQLQMKKIRGADLIIIDDLMYMAMDQNEANLFFHLVNHLYERSAVILTSNKGPEEWGELLGDRGLRPRF